jgi:hypothetical protein
VAGGLAISIGPHLQTNDGSRIAKL